ncbi:MAG: zinc-dependent peptidase [Deltaproteobacteria bacterium]|nr:zinc-dependent peptidase [Deltaproteobacteria bacterium]MDQ3296539.1 zinc-dependent peptidase [Myxococcota bacterium]
MFAWLTERRRKRLQAQPFPAGWDAIIGRNVPVAHRLDMRQAQRLRDLVQVFIAEKSWEGCGGLELTEEMQVTVAAHACLLVLERDLDLYKDVDSILLYPTTIVAEPRKPYLFETVRTPVGHARALLGEAMLHGPVVLAWDAVLASAEPDAAGNVVIHELAHKLDMADGSVDGTPPLPSRRELDEWARVCSAAYRELCTRVELGIPTVIDAYGATNEAEFFAVATETFFLRPRELRLDQPALYHLLARFYRYAPEPFAGFN